MEHLESLETRDQREKWEQEEIRDSVDLLVRMVCGDHPGYKERRAEQVTPVLWVHRGKKETWEILARWDHQEYRELQGWLGNQDSKECQDYLEIQDHQGDRGTQGHLEQMERTVLMVKLENLEHQVTEENLEKMEVLESKD